MRLTRNNISELESEMKQHLTYFEKWREHSLTLKNGPGDKTWEKTFISQQTCNNLRLQVAGFF